VVLAELLERKAQTEVTLYSQQLYLQLVVVEDLLKPLLQMEMQVVVEVELHHLWTPPTQMLLVVQVQQDKVFVVAM
jgi:hypothetical protein